MDDMVLYLLAGGVAAVSLVLFLVASHQDAAQTAKVVSFERSRVAPDTETSRRAA